MNTHRLPIIAALTLLAMLTMTKDIQAQNQALDLARDRNTELTPAMRDNLETIGRYAETVNRRLEARELAPGGAKNRRFEQVSDPFEVSPQLRDDRKGSAAFSGLPNAGRLELQRQIQVEAILITTKNRIAQLNVRDQRITVMDGELVDLGTLGTFEIRIGRDSVTFSNPGAPQATKLILR